MEEEVSYATVHFVKRDSSSPEKQQRIELIYDEVKPASPVCDTKQVASGQDQKQSTHLQLLPVIILGIICVILVSIIIIFGVHFQTIMLAQKTLNRNLTEQNLLLSEEQMNLKNRTHELTRERDRLSWTMGVILDFNSFPVNFYCAQKVCQPCLYRWMLFRSKCYIYFNIRKSQDDSQKYCRALNAQLVVIKSKEEQEFLNNHTVDSNGYGYWIGLWENPWNKWTWIDGSNTTVTYWKNEQENTDKCVILQPTSPALANWKKEYCNYSNYFICEMKTLIMPEDV